MFDRFDIVEAWYLWLCLHHDGKGYARRHSRYWSSYGRLSTMEKNFGYSPRSNLSYETLSENGQEIYRGICRRAHCQHCKEI